MGHKLFLAAREGLYGRMGAIMERWGQGAIWEEYIGVEVMEGGMSKLKVRWDGGCRGVEGKGGVDGWVGGVMGLEGGWAGVGLGVLAYVLVSEGWGMDSGGFMVGGRG